jgi:hypothetical protein
MKFGSLEHTQNKRAELLHLGTPRRCAGVRSEKRWLTDSNREDRYDPITSSIEPS